MNSSDAGGWFQINLHISTLNILYFCHCSHLNIWPCFYNTCIMPTHWSVLSSIHVSHDVPSSDRYAHTRWGFKPAADLCAQSLTGDRWDQLLFQGQCCNLQVKLRNSIPVCEAVTWPPILSVSLYIVNTLVVTTRILHICKQPFFAFRPLYFNRSGPHHHAEGSSGQFQGWLLYTNNKAHTVLWNQTIRQAQC